MLPDFHAAVTVLVVDCPLLFLKVFDEVVMIMASDCLRVILIGKRMKRSSFRSLCLCMVAIVPGGQKLINQ